MKLNNEKNRSITVFIVDSVGARRGMHYYNFPLTSELNKLSNVNAILISTQSTSQNDLRPASLEVWGAFKGIYSSYGKAIRGIFYAFSLFRILCRAIIEKPDLAHFHFFQVPLLDFLFLKALKVMRIAVIITVHDVVPFKNGKEAKFNGNEIFQKIYHTATGLIVNSKNAETILGRLDSELIEKTGLILPGNYIHVTKDLSIDRNQAIQNLDLDRERKYILIFGTIKPNKRLDLVIEALRTINTQDIKLVIVGQPREHDVTRYFDMVANYNLESKVIWRLENVTDEEMGWYFSASDLVVFPYEWIYQSAAILMAMSFGKPIIATAVGSNSEFVQDGKNGLLVPYDNPRELAESINRILGDINLANQLSDGAINYVKNELDWSDIAIETHRFYRQVL